MNVKSIELFVEQNKELQLKLIRDLCKIPAPSHNEEKRAEYCKKFFESIGASNVYIDDAKNVVFPLNCENSNSITVFEAHTDTVFPDLEPYSYKEDDKIIYCPGVNDDTACVVNIMLTAKYFIENDIIPKDGILFVCNSCEEGLGNLKGTRQLFKNYMNRIKQFITADAGFVEITNDCVGSDRYKVTIKTQGGHSFGDFGNENAAHNIAKLINQIYEIDVPHIADSKTTYNVGVVSTGTSINTIPQQAEMLCEYRSDNYECLKIMKAKFREIFKTVESDDVKVEVELIGERPCANMVDQKEMKRIINICAKNIKEVTGEDVTFTHASTDCNIPLSLGVPAIAIGTSKGNGAHTREEYLEKDSLPIGLNMLIRHTLGLTKDE